jgi:hypothetical protein
MFHNPVFKVVKLLDTELFQAMKNIAVQRNKLRFSAQKSIFPFYFKKNRYFWVGV